ncbi:MAG TPA: HAD-IIIC family phosphatase, partial [Methylomirabilota bacterium]|nr:HAD-IIIC family phosphatase [Methylomirabilota bacterium]
IVMHHTISDGWSQSVLLQELRASYDAGLAGTGPLPVDQEALQYADFAAWQRRQLDTSRFRRELAFWEAKLSGAPSTMELPVDHARDGSGVGPRRAGRSGLILPTSHAKAERLTPFMVLVASLGWTLRQWTDQKDMVIGTVTAGRSRREIENVMGCFMNFLPLRLKVNEQETIGQFLEQARSTVLQAQAHQECPFERIVAAVKPDRTKDQNPLYNVALLLQNFPAAAFAGQGLRAEMMPVTLEAALLDLRFEALEQPGGILLECEFRTDLFEPGTVELLLGAIAEVFKTLTARSEGVLNEVKVSPALVAHGQAARRRSKQTIAVAATFTGEPVAESLEYWFQEFGWPAKVEFAPFNQVFQQLLDPASLLGSNQRGSNVVLVRLEDWLTAREGGVPADSNPAELDQPMDDLLRAARAFALRSTAPCLICFCPPSSAAAANAALSGAIARAEKRLESENIPGVYVVTNDELRRLYPVTQCHDPQADELGKVPYTPEMFTALGTVIARKLHALSRPPFKVIVLDCDQTLWSGVCGEDGAKGIRLEPERRALQDFMRSQRDSGMLLCLCSKNNEADVHEVFQQRLEMPLRREHLAGWRLNWLPKSENLKSLARELRLGLDSFIFVDDNPVECAEVEANCPEVLTLRLPEELGQIQHFLEHCWAFDHLKVTQEDRQRAESYRQNLDRERLRETSTGLADFLAGLDLKVQIKPMEPDQLSRVAQLTQRTNQFNCTTRRRTDGEMALVQSEVLAISVTDRFGDYGLVGAVIF